MLTTSMGLLRAEMSVNPTMSLKKIVTQLNCSALTSLSSAGLDLCVFGLDLVVHHQLFGDLLRQHLAKQRLGASFLGSEFQRFDLKLLGVFGHFAQHVCKLSGVPETQSQAGHSEGWPG